MKIREIGDIDDRLRTSLPIQAYAFQSSPLNPELKKILEKNQEYYQHNLTLVAEVDGHGVADASAIEMDQNVRGEVYKMAGVAGVATLPEARRRGFASALVLDLLKRMKERGYVLSSLYPFLPSFYEKFGFVGLPKTRTARFSPACLAGLAKVKPDLPDCVTRHDSRNGYGEYRAFTENILTKQHGFCLLPEFRTKELADASRWIAIARGGGEVVGAVTYTITGHDGVLAADEMLTSRPLGRELLLEFFARHVNQVSQVEVQVGPDEHPELWTTGMEAVTEAAPSYPASPAPMARVLSVEGLAGMKVGEERIVVQIKDDNKFIAGTYMLDGKSGRLEIASEKESKIEAVLSVQGFSALVYGVLDARSAEIRRFGDSISEAAVAKLDVLFPRAMPSLYSHF